MRPLGFVVCFVAAMLLLPASAAAPASIPTSDPPAQVSKPALDAPAPSVPLRTLAPGAGFV